MPRASRIWYLVQLTHCKEACWTSEYVSRLLVRYTSALTVWISESTLSNCFEVPTTYVPLDRPPLHVYQSLGAKTQCVVARRSNMMLIVCSDESHDFSLFGFMCEFFQQIGSLHWTEHHFGRHAVQLSNYPPAGVQTTLPNIYLEAT